MFFGDFIRRIGNVFQSKLYSMDSMLIFCVRSATIQNAANTFTGRIDVLNGKCG